MATQTITFKRASTFYASVTYTPDSGGAPTLDGVTITSDVRDAHGKIYACSVTLTSPTTFSVAYDDTAAWSLGSAYWDIRFANNGVVFFSDTAVLNIVDNITVS